MTVIYHVLYSMSYQVPVLYFFLHNIMFEASLNIETVYERLVPQRNHKALKDTGVLGSIGVVVSLSKSICL